jgi:TetR/AcrR family transcriptional regulator
MLPLPTRSAGRPVADPDRDTRTLLLSAATQLFAEHGVAATTFSTIARRAGLTPAMVHYYFANRDELIDAVVDERLLPFITHVWGPVQPGDPPAAMLAALVHRLMESIEEAPWVPSTWMREILIEGGLLRSRILRRLPIDKVRIVGQAIANGQHSDAINRDLDPLLVVFSALGLVMVHMATIQVWADAFHRSPLDSKAIERHVTGLLLRGLAPAAAATKKPSPTTTSRRRKP